MISANDVLLQVDPEQWSKFCADWKDRHEGFEKYFKLENSISRILANRPLMNLLESRSKLRILDISAGFCALGLVGRALGHDVWITDVDISVVIEAQNILGFGSFRTLHEYPAKDGFPFVRLPDFIGRYNLITAIACAPMRWWDVSAWAAFFHDTFQHLDSGGRIYLQPNYGKGYFSLEKFFVISSMYSFAKHKKGMEVWKQE